MSYEPTLIVEKKDLEKFEDELMGLDLRDDRVGKYLYRVILSMDYCNFKDMELYIFEPEFTSFNKKVREWLDEHNIEYGEDN